MSVKCAIDDFLRTTRNGMMDERPFSSCGPFSVPALSSGEKNFIFYCPRGLSRGRRAWSTFPLLHRLGAEELGVAAVKIEEGEEVPLRPVASLASTVVVHSAG